MKMRVAILHACPLALQVPSSTPTSYPQIPNILHSSPLALQHGESFVPLVWREPGFEEMKNAMNSYLEASELTRNMPIAIEMKHACNSSFDAVFGQKVAPDVLILSGQELELLDPLQQQLLHWDQAFNVIIEDDVGAAASLDCPRLMKMKPEQFPKVIIVHGNFASSTTAISSSSSSFSPSCPSPAEFLLSAGAISRSIGVRHDDSVLVLVLGFVPVAGDFCFKKIIIIPSSTAPASSLPSSTSLHHTSLCPQVLPVSSACAARLPPCSRATLIRTEPCSSRDGWRVPL